MLTITRLQSSGGAATAFLKASVSFREGLMPVADCPDILLTMRTYQRIARDENRKKAGESSIDLEGNQSGDQILLPINLFFQELSEVEQRVIYDLYAFAKMHIDTLTLDNRRNVQEVIQDRVYQTVHGLGLADKMIEFCRTPRFLYPDPKDKTDVGKGAHHTEEKTYHPEDYIQVTAISLLSKLMVPIWGEFIAALEAVDINQRQREKMAFDLVEATLEDGAFSRIYAKLFYTLGSRIIDIRKTFDSRAESLRSAKTSFILTHNSIDDDMFESIVMAAIVVKRMATYSTLLPLADGRNPDAMVYIYDGIKRTVAHQLQIMSQAMDTMPRIDQSSHGDDDNSSIIDYISKTSNKPIDASVLVSVAAEKWEIDKMVELTNTPRDVFEAAADYYQASSFDVSPLCQAMVATFVGRRLCGSKPLGWLTSPLYQRLVVLLQVYLIRNDMLDLASLVSAKTSMMPIEGSNPLVSIIETQLETQEYLKCKELFKGYTVKPAPTLGKKPSNKNKDDGEKIDFVTHIRRMVDWLTHYSHAENMAPALWTFANHQTHPIIGSQCRYDEKTMHHLYRFYLQFHGTKRPF
jgi:hypothetical protein